MCSANAASNNQETRSNNNCAKNTGSYFHAIWFNFSSTYYFGWLPEKLAIYMLYFFLGTLALILNPFSGFYQAAAAAISGNSGVIGAELLRRYVTSGIVSVLFTFALRYLYKTIIKALSRCFAVDQGNALRNVSQTLIYYSRNKINSAIDRTLDGKARFIANNEQNYSSGTRDVFGKCDYFLQSMCMSIFNFIVVATTLGPSVGVLSFSIFGTCLIVANVAAYFWAKYSLAGVVKRNASNKPALTKCVSEVIDCKDDDELNKRSFLNIERNKTAKKELVQTSKLDFIRGLMDTKFTQIIVTIVLVSAGISANYPLLVVMAGQIAELMENGIPLLSQAQTMAQLSTTYGQTKNHFDYLKDVDAIPKGSASNPMYISETEYAMLYLKAKGKKQYLKDIVNTLQLTSSLAFACFSLYQYLSFLGAYEMAYIMPQLFPNAFAFFASTAAAHFTIATGFILTVILAGAVINAAISMFANIYEKNKDVRANHITLQSGYRSPPSAKLSQSLRVLLSFKHLIPNNPYNPIFATTWAFPILIVATRVSALSVSVFSVPFLIGFIGLSVLLSIVANGLLTPSYNQYLSFENRINNNPSFSPVSRNGFKSASSFQPVPKVKSAPDMHHNRVPSTTTTQNIAKTPAERLREIAYIVRHPVAPLSSTSERAVKA